MIISKKKRSELIIEKYKLLNPNNVRYADEIIKAKENFYNKFISITENIINSYNERKVSNLRLHI